MVLLTHKALPYIPIQPTVYVSQQTKKIKLSRLKYKDILLEIQMLSFHFVYFQNSHALFKKMEEKALIRIGILLLLLVLTNNVSFQSLYNRQLKSSYGFEILKHYHSEPFGNEDVKKFKGQSVLFMTPWREKGINMSLKYMKKFDYFVPCYYDLRKEHSNQTVAIDISKYYSQDYLAQVKEANPNIQILPRIYVHGMQGDVFFLASTKEEEYARIISYVDQILQNPYYSGIVFSSPFITPNHQYPFSMKNFMKSVREKCDLYGKKLFITMDGVDQKPDQKINKKKAREIIDLVDRVIIANYDCPRGNQGITIPISPMDWIKQNYEFYCEVYSKTKITPKLIMAIPLYGYFVAMYGKYDPIDGEQMLKKLKNEKQAWLSWNQEIEECMIYLNKIEYIYFPCLHFLSNRMRYFESVNVGVAAFEIGSGLQIFMQLF